MGKIIAVTNQKGGVGKTTTSVNLAASLAATQLRVLLVDMDPQGNATMGCGVNKSELASSTLDLLLQNVDASSCIVPGPETGVDVIPANADLTAAEVKLIHQDEREKKLSQMLQPVVDNYDYIVIDCPPSLNMLTLNALVAANSVLIPMQCEYYSLEGLSALMETLKDIRNSVNSNLVIEGLLRTMYDARSRLTKEVSDQLMEYFGDKVFRTCIPRNIRLAEAPSHGLPVLMYDRSSRGALAYLALASEIVRRDQKSANSAG